MTSARALGSLGHLPRHTRLPFCRTATEVSLIDTSNPTYCSMAALPGDRRRDSSDLARPSPGLGAAHAPGARGGAPGGGRLPPLRLDQGRDSEPCAGGAGWLLSDYPMWFLTQRHAGRDPVPQAAEAVAPPA